jgi:phosphoribosylaminoimidazole-succinocarboxamide synthase
MTTALHTSALTSLPLLARGKVRDNYAVGDDRILMVASDRISAFDVIMGEPIPGKGALLTQMALFWFDKLGHICPNHLTGDAPRAWWHPMRWPQVIGPLHAGQAPEAPSGGGGGARLPGRQRLEGIPGDQAVCGVPLPGPENASSCPSPSTRRPPRPSRASTTRTSPSSKRWR